jgi:hypothetical protein
MCQFTEQRTAQRNKSKTFVALSTDNKKISLLSQENQNIDSLAMPCQIRGTKQDVLSVRGTLCYM